MSEISACQPNRGDVVHRISVVLVAWGSLFGCTRASAPAVPVTPELPRETSNQALIEVEKSEKITPGAFVLRRSLPAVRDGKPDPRISTDYSLLKVKQAVYLRPVVGVRNERGRIWLMTPIPREELATPLYIVCTTYENRFASVADARRALLQDRLTIKCESALIMNDALVYADIVVLMWADELPEGGTDGQRNESVGDKR